MSQKFHLHMISLTAKPQDLVPFQVLLSFHIAVTVFRTLTHLCIWASKLLFSLFWCRAKPAMHMSLLFVWCNFFPQKYLNFRLWLFQSPLLGVFLP